MTSHAPPGSAGGTAHLLITGASSGIGLAAARLLHAEGLQLTLPCRNDATARELACLLPGAATPVCDLADLSSVERCSRQLLAAGQPIDSLVLNAGLQYSGAGEPRWSAQGIELSVAVNHLAHQALLQRLLPLLRSSAEPRLVVTASEVHDPASPGGRVGRPAGLGELTGLRPGSPMLAGGRFDAEKAYKDSKLCNLLMAREAARRLGEQARGLRVLAWSPGLVIARGQGGFFRYSRALRPAAQAAFALIARDLLRLTESPQRAGALLAVLASGDPSFAERHGIEVGSVGQAAGFHYWSNRVLGPGRRRFEPCEPSREASDADLARRLWDQSEALAAALTARSAAG